MWMFSLFVKDKEIIIKIKKELEVKWYHIKLISGVSNVNLASEQYIWKDNLII